MEKLSELSKPVAWKLHHHDRYYFEENADVVAIAESVGKAKGDAVYSQEYVSALDGVAQFWIGESAGWKKRAEDAEKRIAELEAKLATPVRLPGSFYPDGDIDCPLVVELDAAVEAIRAAGFTVEGDE
ncbi:TPA: hypothetical protein SMI17_003056 [Serratia marcescens]|nr:hypothetical protein [Serratia marcescens]